MPWYSKYLTLFEKPFSDVPATVIEKVKVKMQQMQSENLRTEYGWIVNRAKEAAFGLPCQYRK